MMNALDARAGNGFIPGSLVRARGRDWVALPSDAEGVLRLRPVDGSDSDAVGIYAPLEPDAASPAEYAPPNPDKAGDFGGALLLRDAARLRLRSGAGPFRSMGRVSVVPRPYQFVPLAMALRQNPVRLLIADDVGVGKTIEAAMIARETLDRGAARRIGVLCAPHLCEQWADELETKFGISAAVVQSSTVRRLERGLPRADISIYRHYRHLVMSVDFVKAERRKAAFLADAPDFIIIDEAHTAARPGGAGGAAHQRYELARELSKDRARHLVLATATPHSGVEEGFRSLLGLLDESLDVPIEREPSRRKMVPLFVQRRRADIEKWLGEETPFPQREGIEVAYRMSPEYFRLYESALRYCREFVSVEGKRRQRVRYWAALSILRSVLSSPAAALAALENRKRKTQNGGDEARAGESAFRDEALDSSDDEQPPDYAPTAALNDPDAALEDSDVRRLDSFLKRASALKGPERDAKLAAAARAARELIDDGFSPIIFCRFINTANYVAEQLGEILGKDKPSLRVRAVTGSDGGSEQRAEIVRDLAKEPLKILVATDCLSEGINLQDHYDAVVHYDLPWNPNRLEQREGRVDRFGQKKRVVKTALLYGEDNHMDLVILDVLIRKAKTIRRRLGTSVPVPMESEHVIDALISDVLNRRRDDARQLTLGIGSPEVNRLHEAWDRRADAESRTRTHFAQRGIRPGEIARELREMEPALGGAKDVRRFIANAIQRFNGELRAAAGADGAAFDLFPGDLEALILDRMNGMGRGGVLFPMRAAFEGVPPAGAETLGRNHPVVDAVSEAALARALSESEGDTLFARSGAIVTDAVAARTAVLILRLRYLIKAESDQFAEEIVCAAFQRGGDGGGLRWLQPLDKAALKLLQDAVPVANMPQSERREHVKWALDALENEDGWHKGIVAERAAALADAHSRLRKAVKSAKAEITPHEPPDIIGAYALIPSGAG